MALLSRLRACVPDERDIPALLADAAGGGQRVTRAGVAEFLTSGPEPVVFARLRIKDGLIDRLQPGPGLGSQSAQDQFVARASVEGAQTHGTLVTRRVLFAQIPLRGSFVWRDRLRITPCPRGAHVGRGLDWSERARLPLEGPGHLGPPFPLVLEVRSFRSPNAFLETNRYLRDLDTYQHLLTLFLHGRIRYAHHQSERQWTSVRRRNRIEYHLLYPGFDSGLDSRSDDFARRRVRRAPIYSGPDYENHLWGQDEQLHLPDKIDSDLETYEELPHGIQRRFNRACYWYSLGTQFHNEPSLSTVAFSTAVECLLPRPSTSSCPSCGKPTGAGPTKLFNEHLKKYGILPDSLHARRDAIYAVRSALVHGSHSKRTDDNFFGSVDSFIDPLLIELVVRRSLLGWLRDAGRKA